MADESRSKSLQTPQQSNLETLDFQEWSNLVRQQMLACLKKRYDSGKEPT